MTNDQIKHMVDRFLQWPMPAGTAADRCASDPNYPHVRFGTHLLSATDAESMLRFVVEGMPTISPVERLAARMGATYVPNEATKSASSTTQLPADDVDVIETIEEAADMISDRLSGSGRVDGLKMEAWVEGRTMTVMFHDTMQFAKFRLVGLRNTPTRADLKGEPE